MEHVNTTAPEKADALMEAMFHAYFELAQDLSDPVQLAAVAQQVGVQGADHVLAIGSSVLRDEVLSAVHDSQTRLRVTGVPFFVIEPVTGGRPCGFSGAQVSLHIINMCVSNLPFFNVMN